MAAGQDTDAEKETINGDVVFEIELVKQVEINVDYILMLVEQYRQAKGDGEDKEIRAAIARAVDSSPSLRNKKDLIEAFVVSVSATGSVDEEWEAFISARRAEELAAIVADESLKPAETQAFVDMAFRNGAVPTTGTGITKILPPASRFAGPGAGHADTKRRVLDKLTQYLDRYLGLGGLSRQGA